MKTYIQLILLILMFTNCKGKAQEPPKLESNTYQTLIGNICEETIEEQKCVVQDLVLQIHFKTNNTIEVLEIEKDNCGSIINISNKATFSFTWGKNKHWSIILDHPSQAKGTPMEDVTIAYINDQLMGFNSKNINTEFASFIFEPISYKNLQPMTNLGIGILEANTSYEIPFYKNPQDATPITTLSFLQMKYGAVKFKCNVKLKPYQMYEGETLDEIEELENAGLIALGPKLTFIVIEETPKYYRVIANSETNTPYYIKKDPKAANYITQKERDDSREINRQWYVFETWERYFKRIQFIELHNLEIYDRPNGKIMQKLTSNAYFPFNIKRVQGNWLQLQKITSMPAADFKKNTNYDGWYQWRDQNGLRIEIIEETYE